MKKSFITIVIVMMALFASSCATTKVVSTSKSHTNYYESKDGSYAKCDNYEYYETKTTVDETSASRGSRNGFMDVLNYGHYYKPERDFGHSTEYIHSTELTETTTIKKSKKHGYESYAVDSTKTILTKNGEKKIGKSKEEKAYEKARKGTSKFFLGLGKFFDTFYGW